MAVLKTAKVWLGGRTGLTAPIRVSQYDTGWQFQLTVYKDDNIYVGSGSEIAVLNGKKANGSAFSVAGTFASGIATFNCPVTITEAVGVTECELRLTSSGETVGTANFDVIVEKAPLSGYYASREDFSAVAQLIDNMVARVPDAAADWLDEHITNPSNPPIDTSLTVPSAAADAAVTGARIREVRRKFVETENKFTDENQVEGILNASGVVYVWQDHPEFRTTDFLPVEPGDRYIFYTQVDGLRRVQVVCFYDASKAFVSRQTEDTYQTEVPADCYYVRLTSPVGNPGFPAKFMMTKNVLCPYVPNQRLNNVETTEKAIVDLKMKVEGLSSFVDDILCPYTIGANNTWQNVPNSFHFMLPVKEGDNITLSAGRWPGVYALLKSRRFYIREAPDFVDKYTVIESDIGEPTFIPETDEHGQYVLDERHSVPRDKSVSLVAVPDSAYLYCSYSYPIVEHDVVVGTAYNGLDVTINGVKLYSYEADSEKEKKIYETIFFDDFDALNTDIWTLHTEPAPTRGKYRSRFYTDETNVWCEQSTLVMRVAKVAPGNDGHYIPKGETTSEAIDYHAPYVSTCDSLAIPKGRISARLKTSDSLAANGFVGCLWTFGQNAPWGFAHEMDVMETTQGLIPQDGAWSKSGVFIPGGSVRTVAAFNLHTSNQAGVSQAFSTLALISIALKNGSTYADDEVFYAFRDGFDMADWHTYAVEWDEENIFIFVDDLLFASYNAASIGAYDEDGNIGFNHPQDIRINFKCDSELATDDGFLFVDWVKAEVLNKTPCISISHAPVFLNVGEEMYIEPTFNENCSNKAFAMESNDSCVVVEKFLRPDSTSVNDNNSFMVVHKIKAISPGNAQVTITSANGVTQSTFTVTVTQPQSEVNDGEGS